VVHKDKNGHVKYHHCLRRTLFLRTARAFAIVGSAAGYAMGCTRPRLKRGPVEMSTI